ncbi:MAG: hypothetical protein WBA43_05135 [Elainellaceae cyanobacterium]
MKRIKRKILLSVITISTLVLLTLIITVLNYDYVVGEQASPSYNYILVNELSELNYFKDNLQSQLIEIEESSLQQDEKESEFARIKAQIEIANKSIDALINNPEKSELALSNRDEEFPESLQWLKWTCYFLATIVGILFKALWESPSINALFKFRNIKPILIAPIIFYGVYTTINTISDDLLAILIAFQNGFFWQSILKSEERKIQNNLVDNTTVNTDS